MIFGFNTDVKFGATVYHVQSEARVGECLLQTQVFVRGQCIGKKAASYSELVERPEFSEGRMHEMLKAQHRSTLDDLRAGRVDDALTHVTPLRELLAELSQTHITTTPPEPEPVPVEASDQLKALTLDFLNPETVSVNHSVLLQFRVASDGVPVGGAKLIARFTKVNERGEDYDPVFAQDSTEPDGSGEMEIPVDLAQVTHGVVLVQATHEGRSAMKKFRLKTP